jgi:hypothetical protein
MPEHAVSKRRKNTAAITVANWEKTDRLAQSSSAEPGKR